MIGTITVGEFRQHVRGVGLEATSEELDALFTEWDTVSGYKGWSFSPNLRASPSPD